MAQCRGSAAGGHRCRRSPQAGSEYCTQHAGQGWVGAAKVAGVGAVVGHILAPGVGGAMVGALVATVAGALTDATPRKKRVFVSFDFDNDAQLKRLLVGQSKNGRSPFEIADWSLKEAAPEPQWKSRAAAAIARSDVVVVLLGQHTHRAQGVLAEVRMAKEARKQMVQLIGTAHASCKRVSGAGPTYAWTWANLEKIFL